VILGRFVDARGKPIQTGKIEFEYQYQHVTMGRGAAVKIEALGDGGFKLKGAWDPAGLLPGVYRLCLYDTGSPPAMSGWTDPVYLEEGETVQGIETTALTAAAVNVRVIDEASGLPIPGASLKAMVRRNGRSTEFPSIETKADGDGRCRMEGIPIGGLRLKAAAPGYEDLEKEIVVIGDRDEEVTLTMSPQPPAPPETTTVLRLLVADSLGRPMAGARVVGYSHGLDVWPEEMLADGQGVATILVTIIEEGGPRSGAGNRRTRFQPERIQVDVEGKLEEWIDVTSDLLQTGSMAVTLWSAGVIEGLVLDHEGRPMRGIDVIARGERSFGKSLTSRDGTYSIGDLRPGIHEVEVASAKRPIPRSRREVAVEEGKAVRLDLKIANPAMSLFPVLVSVMFDDGTPIGNRDVYFIGAWPGEKREGRGIFPVTPLSWKDQFRTDPEGKAVLHFEEPVQLLWCGVTNVERDGEPYRLRRESSGPLVRVEAGEARLICERVPTCKDLMIRVVDASTGRPVAPYRFYYKAAHSGSGRICRSPDGEVHYRGVIGEVEVTVEAEGYEKASKKITVEDRGRHRLEFSIWRAPPGAR